MTPRFEVNRGSSGDKASLAKRSAGLSVAMSAPFNHTMSLIDSDDNRPPVGHDKNDIGTCPDINVKLGAH